jgi:hypothetical protein
MFRSAAQTRRWAIRATAVVAATSSLLVAAGGASVAEDDPSGPGSAANGPVGVAGSPVNIAGGNGAIPGAEDFLAYPSPLRANNGYADYATYGATGVIIDCAQGCFLTSLVGGGD